MMLMLTAVDCRRQRAPAWSSCQGVARVAPASSWCRGVDALASMAGGAVTTFLTPLQLPLPTHTPTRQPSQHIQTVASGIPSSTDCCQLHRNCLVRPRCCCCASLLLTSFAAQCLPPLGAVRVAPPRRQPPSPRSPHQGKAHSRHRLLQSLHPRRSPVASPRLPKSSPRP